MLNGSRWDWSGQWSDDDEQEAHELDRARAAPDPMADAIRLLDQGARNRGEIPRFVAPAPGFQDFPLRPDAPTGSLEESLREDAKWERDDGVQLDGDEPEQ